MFKFGIWILCFTAHVAYKPILSFKAESASNDVIRLKFPLNARTESFPEYHSRVSDTNLRSKRITQLLRIQQGIKPTTDLPNPSHDSHSTTTNWRLHPTKSPSKLGGPSSDYVTTYSSDSLKTPRQDDLHKLRKGYSSFPFDIRSYYRTPLYKYFTERSLTTYNFLSFEDEGSSEETNDECHNNYDCQKVTKYSICQFAVTRRECRCAEGYIHDRNVCLRETYVGGFCQKTVQCPVRSYCTDDRCTCIRGYVRRETGCEIDTPFSGPPNFLLALIAGVVFLIVVSCLFVIIMALRRKLQQARSNSLPEDTPSISAAIDARRPVSPDPAYQRIDKPPTYDEAMSSSTTLLTLGIQDISSEPPSYVEVQQARRNTELRSVS